MTKVIFNKPGVGKSRQDNGKKEGSFSLMKVFVVIGVTVASLFMLYNSYRSIILTQEKLGILDQAEEDVMSLRLQNLDLLLESTSVTTDYYVELHGRNRLHLSREGEFVFIIPEDLLTSSELDLYYSSFIPRNAPSIVPEGVSGWISFFNQGV